MSRNAETGRDRLARANRGMGCGILIALPFALGGVIVFWLAITQFSGWWECRSWVTRPATIRSVELQESHDSEGGTTYHVDATYDYQVAGRAFTGDRVWVGTGSDNIGDFHQRVYSELQHHHVQNRPFRCFVDPSQPSRSVLYRDLRLGLLAFECGFALIFGGVGFGLLIGLWIASRRAQLAAELSDQFPNEPWRWDTSLPEGRYRPHKTWILPLVGCCVANGVGWIVAILIIPKIQQQPFLAFVWIFPVAAITMIFPALQAARRRLKYGAPELQVIPWPLRVGESAQFLLDTENRVEPESTLTVKLIVKHSLDSETSNTLFESQSTAMVSVDGLWSSEMKLPEGFPRTKGILDDKQTPDAKWVLEIRDLNDKWGFEAIYQLQVFDGTGDCTNTRQRS